MDQASTSPGSGAQRIDLTQQTDVAYWCRIFDVTMEELREAVQAAGHDSSEVERYLRDKQAPGG